MFVKNSLALKNYSDDLHIHDQAKKLFFARVAHSKYFFEELMFLL